MNLLRRAAIETTQGLGVKVPIVATVVLSIGFTIAITSNLSAPETDSVKGFELWLFQSIAWAISVVVVFIPLLVWNIRKVVRRDVSMNAHLEMAAESASSVDDEMKSYLRNELRNPKCGVAECYVFGSIVGQYQTRDVDIIVQFNSSKQGKVRRHRDRLRVIESNFKQSFDTKLHVQTFLLIEYEDLHRFLDVAGVHDQLI